MLFLTLLLCLAGLTLGLWRFRDPLHPLVLLAGMCLFMYVLMPSIDGVDRFIRKSFSDSEVLTARAACLLMMFSLFGGCFYGSVHQAKITKRSGLRLRSGLRVDYMRIAYLGCFFGLVSFLIYLYNTSAQGGFVHVYSQVKGSVAINENVGSGYLRDPVILSVAASFLLMLAGKYAPSLKWYFLASLFFLLPLFFQAFLQSRRGPAFMAIVAFVGSYYLSQRKKPPVLIFVTGGFLLGSLLLFLVTFRSNIHLNSGFLKRVSIPQIVESIGGFLEKETTSNESFYSTNVIASSIASGRCYWGSRYATIVFIRPIPKQIWPTKYEDVGMAEYAMNAGLGREGDLLVGVGQGGATGFAADVFLEFSWLGMVFCCFVGFYFGKMWRLARRKRASPLSIVNYGCLMVLSIYFVTQTFEAFIFRYLVIMVPTCIFWRIFMGGDQGALALFRRPFASNKTAS